MSALLLYIDGNHKGAEGASRGRWHISVEEGLINRGHSLVLIRAFKHREFVSKRQYFAGYARTYERQGQHQGADVDDMASRTDEQRQGRWS